MSARQRSVRLFMPLCPQSSVLECLRVCVCVAQVCRRVCRGWYGESESRNIDGQFRYRIGSMGNQEQDVGLCVWVCKTDRGCAIVCLTFCARLVGVA